MDINTFGEMLLSTDSTPSQNVLKSSTKDSTDIVGLLHAHNFSAVESLVPNLSKKEVNTTAVMMALVENFDYGVADLLCKKGLDPARLLDSKGLLVCAPTLEFWGWLMGAEAVSNVVYENILSGVFNLLNDPIPLDDPRRTSSAQFVFLVKKYNSKLFKEVISYSCIEDFAMGHHTQNIHPDQYDMLEKCIDKSDWEEIIFEIDPCTVKDFEKLVHACQRVSNLNDVYIERFETAKKMHEWKIKNMASPTGTIKDCVLIGSLPAESRTKTTSMIKKIIDLRFLTWGCSEVEMVVLSTRDPSDAYEPSNVKLLENISFSAGHQNFLHMMMSQVGAKFAKGLHQTAEVEQKIFENLGIVDCHLFVKTSTITDLNTLFKIFPKTLEWNDMAGNHLGHYIAQNGELSSNMMGLLMKNPSLRRPNPSGVSPRDILQHRTPTKNLEKFDQMISQYDKKMLQRLLKETPDVEAKMRSRKLPARKM